MDQAKGRRDHRRRLTLSKVARHVTDLKVVPVVVVAIGKVMSIIMSIRQPTSPSIIQDQARISRRRAVVAVVEGQ